MNYKLSFVLNRRWEFRGKYVQKSDDSKSIRSSTPLPFATPPFFPGPCGYGSYLPTRIEPKALGGESMSSNYSPPENSQLLIP